MPGRQFNSSSYKYGFNGQEKDDEIDGSGNVNTAMFWEYDSRIGKRWNIDPVVKPYLSTYAVLSNNPIIMIDPSGNTDFYWSGKWIGTDGNNNGLIAVVKAKDIKNEIKAATEKGQNAKDYHLCSGDANAQFNVLHSDILIASTSVLKKAITTKNDLVTEHSQVLIENTTGGYDKKAENSSGTKIVDSQGQDRVMGGPTPSGDVRIHSHPVGTNLNTSNGQTDFYDANKPTTCDGITGGDMCGDANYKLNVIVGKNGNAAPAVNKNGNWEAAPDDRSYNINIFGSDSKKIFSIDLGTANDILSGSKNQKRKEKFLAKQKQDTK